MSGLRDELAALHRNDGDHFCTECGTAYPCETRALLDRFPPEAEGEAGEARLTVLATKVERLRRYNPMNGDGYNIAIDHVERILSDAGGDEVLAAIGAESDRAEAYRTEQHLRLEAENRARHRAALAASPEEQDR